MCRIRSKNHSLVSPPMSSPGSPTNVTFSFFFKSFCFRAIFNWPKWERERKTRTYQSIRERGNRVSFYVPPAFERLEVSAIYQRAGCLFYLLPHWVNQRRDETGEYSNWERRHQCQVLADGWLDSKGSSINRRVSELSIISETDRGKWELMQISWISH